MKAVTDYKKLISKFTMINLRNLSMVTLCSNKIKIQENSLLRLTMRHIEEEEVQRKKQYILVSAFASTAKMSVLDSS